MTAKYVLGIDLGTTNSVLAYATLGQEEPRIELLPIPQLVAPGTIESRTALPSFAYLAAEHEAASGTFDVPWQSQRDYAVGELAPSEAALTERHLAGSPQAAAYVAKVRTVLKGLFCWETARSSARVSATSIVCSSRCSVAMIRLTRPKESSCADRPNRAVSSDFPSRRSGGWRSLPRGCGHRPA